MVDDASTDGSREIADSFRTEGVPVRCIALERNSGPGSARNAGIASTKSPLVAFLDADDWWEPDHCASLGALLDLHSTAVLSFSETQADDESSSALSSSSIPPGAPGEPQQMLEALLYDSFIPQSAVMARRSDILRVGGYRDGMRHSEDYDLWLRLAHNREFVASGTATCIRFAHPGQATHQASQMYRGAWEARAHYCSYASSLGDDHTMSVERYRELCAAAYERDLAWAWQSRNFAVLRDVINLSNLVPGGEPLRRQWKRRAVFLWPFWRTAAYCWDSLPQDWRSAIKARRSSTTRADA